MGYKLHKTGDQVRDDLNAVEEKTIYPIASKEEDGLMSKEQAERFEELSENEVAHVNIGETQYKPSGGAVNLPAYPSTPQDVGLGNVGNYKAVSVEASQELNSQEKSNARENIGAGTSNFGGSYNDLTDKPEIPNVDTASVDTCISIIGELQ